MFKNTRMNELTFTSASVLLSAQIFINSRFNFDVDSSTTGKRTRQTRKEREQSSKILGVSQIEIFDLFQRQRLNVLLWLQAHPEETNEVCE